MWGVSSRCEGRDASGQGPRGGQAGARGRVYGALRCSPRIFALHGPKPAANRAPPHGDGPQGHAPGTSVSGRSSGVEHNLAKVGVGRSNRLARSIFLKNIDPLKRIAIMRIPLPRLVGHFGEAWGKQKSEFRSAFWRLHCDIVNLMIPRRKGRIRVCSACSVKVERVQSDCPISTPFETAGEGPGVVGPLLDELSAEADIAAAYGVLRQ